MNNKKTKAKSELEKIGISEAELQSEWKEQVKRQTKPLARKLLKHVMILCHNICPGQSKNLAKKAAENAQALQITSNSYKATVKDLEEKLVDEEDEDELSDITSTLRDARKKVMDLKDL